MQSFDVPPLQVRHIGEQLAQPVPLLYDPVGHGTPFDVLVGTESHFVLSVGFWVKADWQVMQFPVISLQLEHPI